MKTVAVFCGSQTGSQPEYADAAQELGHQLAKNQLGLVYGGGRIGLMGVVARAVKAKQGQVIGVIPHALESKEIAFHDADELIVVKTMHERKAIMADRADAFVVLPGGFGTCDELFEILTWAQLGIHHKPVVLLNVCGFFNPMLAWVGHMVAEGFLKPKYQVLLQVALNVEEVLSVLKSAPSDKATIGWLQPDQR